MPHRQRIRCRSLRLDRSATVAGIRPDALRASACREHRALTNRHGIATLRSSSSWPSMRRPWLHVPRSHVIAARDYAGSLLARSFAPRVPPWRVRLLAIASGCDCLSAMSRAVLRCWHRSQRSPELIAAQSWSCSCEAVMRLTTRSTRTPTGGASRLGGRRLPWFVRRRMTTRCNSDNAPCRSHVDCDLTLRECSLHVAAAVATPWQTLSSLAHRPDRWSRHRLCIASDLADRAVYIDLRRSALHQPRTRRHRIDRVLATTAATAS